MAIGNRAEGVTARLLRQWLGVALVGLLCCLVPASQALAQVAGLSNYSNWESGPVEWGQVQAIDASATFVGPITANYNMAYGATVLGLNARQGGTTYYAVVANYHDAQVDVLDAVGPLPAPVQWQSGPYHLAAGLTDGSLIAFLTAPGEYPQQVRLSLDYASRTPFCCVVRPPQPVNADWSQWTITAAFEQDTPEAELITQTYDGNGRVLDSAQSLPLSGQLRSVVYQDLPVPDNYIPVLGLVTSNGVAAAWHEYGWGWHTEQLAGASLDNCRLEAVADPAEPGLLSFFQDEGDPFGLLRLQLIDMKFYQGEVSIRWGLSGVMTEQLDFRSIAFIDSQLTPLPLVAVASDSDIHLVSLASESTPSGKQLAVQDVLLHSGERRTGNDGNPPRYPILALAGAAHWRTGYPEVFWVQLGSEFGGGGQLFRLGYRPQER